MRLSPLSLMGSSYADNSLTWSAQRTLNWLPETAEVEGTRTPIKFADIPGLRAVVDLGTGLPIRGLHNVEGKLFAVSSTSLFEISTAFAVTNRGNIPGVTRVSMAHNKQGGAAAANELVIANGLSGYVYNTSTQSLVQITDDAFQGATTVDYVDGYITFTDPQGRFWGHSALNQATSFSSIDRYDAESAPDPIISHIVSHREVMVFGTRTIEFFRNTGAATGTFQRVDGTELEVGICSPYARSRVDNSVCWVSDGLEVFRLEGHAPQRISDRPIEQLLSTINPANIFTFAWEDRGHKVFYVTAPEAFTIGFDFASGMWHERQTFDLPRWRANALVAWNGYQIVGDYTNGLLYVLDWDTHHENGLELIRERASGYTHGGQNKVLAPYVELLFDVGPDGDIPEIVGDVPDGSVGDPVSGSYVVSGGIMPYGPIMVLSGTFPDGLTLNTDGTYSGTYTAAGSYSWTVGGTDAVGSAFSTPDTATVEESAFSHWWLIFSDTTGPDDKVWFSLDPLTWSDQTTRSPNVNANYGLHWTGSRMVAYSGAAGQAETTADLDLIGPLATTITTPDHPGANLTMRLHNVGGVLFTLGETSYSYSTDGGLTWQNATSPGSDSLWAIERLASGRWIALTSNGFGRFYYSDGDPLPTTWTLASNPNVTGAPEYGLFPYAGGAFHIGNNQGIRRTTNGTSWAFTAGLFPFTFGSREINAAGDGNGVWIVADEALRRIARTDDDGLTWAIVNLPGGAVADTPAHNGVQYGNGRFVVCYTTTAYVSSDLGLTWTASTLPVTGEGGTPHVAFARLTP